jgi:hypothetical protein
MKNFSSRTSNFKQKIKLLFQAVAFPKFKKALKRHKNSKSVVSYLCIYCGRKSRKALKRNAAKVGKTMTKSRIKSLFCSSVKYTVNIPGVE